MASSSWITVQRIVVCGKQVEPACGKDRIYGEHVMNHDSGNFIIGVFTFRC